MKVIRDNASPSPSLGLWDGGNEVVSALLPQGSRRRTRGHEPADSGDAKAPQGKVLHEHLMRFWSCSGNWCNTIMIIISQKQVQNTFRAKVIIALRISWLERPGTVLKISHIPVYTHTHFQRTIFSEFNHLTPFTERYMILKGELKTHFIIRILIISFY